MLNKNQIRRCETVFPSNTEAIDYIIQNTTSLYGEPLVVRYGDEDAPNVILAIASKTNDHYIGGEPDKAFNRYTIIDITNVEGDIEDLRKLIEAVERSLTIIPEESDTVAIQSDKTSGGTYLSADVKVADSMIFDGVVTPDIILTSENGIFTYVDLDFDPSTDTFTFQVNGDKKYFQYNNNYVVSGMYMTTDESVHLKMKKGPDVVIDMKKLINEWTVEGSGSSTPIVLTRERVESSGTPEVWQDVLKADVRIVDGEDNILERHNDGEALYVKGVASNIKYKDDLEPDVKTVKDGLDEALAIARSKTISIDPNNIIYRKEDGIFALSKIDYDPTANTITYSSSTVDGGVEVKTLQLTGVELFTEVRYDADTEELVIKYKDNTGTEQTVRVPLGGLVEEWEVDNHDKTVTLAKTRVVAGKDKLSADVNIATGLSDNILTKYGTEYLYVKGTADNIKYSSNKNVLEKLNEIDATDADQTAKITSISSQTTANTASISNEIARATAAETAISGVVSQNTSDIAQEVVRATSAETAISGAVASEIARATAKDAELDAKVDAATVTYGETTTIRLDKDSNKKVTGVLKLANADGNIISVDGSNHGVYANVNLTYDGGTNKLTFTSSSISGGTVEKVIQLNGGSLIDSIVYDSVGKNIIITYTDQHGISHTVTLPVEELFNEWIVDNPSTDSAVELTKTVGTSGNPDVLSARVILSGLETNIVRFDSNGLYVDGTPISANTQNLATLSGQVQVHESLLQNISGDSGDIAALSAQVQTHETRINSIDSQITGMNNRMNVIEGRFVSIEENIRQNTQDIAQEVSDRSDADTALQRQITENKVTAANESMTVTASSTGTTISVGRLDAGYL